MFSTWLGQVGCRDGTIHIRKSQKASLDEAHDLGKHTIVGVDGAAARALHTPRISDLEPLAPRPSRPARQ